MTRLPSALTALALVVVITTGCSGGSSGGAADSPSPRVSTSSSPTGVAPAAYMHQVCGSLVDRLKQVNALVKNYERKVRQDAPRGGLPALKRDTITYFNGAVRQFQGMRSGVADAGIPAVDNGAKVRADLVDALSILVRAAQRAQADVRHLSTTDRKAFSRRLLRDGRVVGRAGDQVGTALDKDSEVGGSELDQAAKHDPLCTKLNA